MEPNADQIGIPRKQDNMALKGQTLDQQEDPCVPIYKPFMGYQHQGGQGRRHTGQGTIIPVCPPFEFVERSCCGASVAAGCEGP